MVLPVVAALSGAIKVKDSQTLIDSQVFRFHYRWTTLFCLACCALTTAYDYIGDPIQCLSGLEAVPKPINTYCWIQSTFTINSTGPMKGLGKVTDNTEKRLHSYYQWVAVILFIQAMMFYLPHWIWKSYEGKQVDLLLQDLNKNIFDDSIDKKIANIVKYLKHSWNLNSSYSMGYFICEALNFVNVIGQMFLMDKFFQGFFMQYGTKVLQVTNTDDVSRHDIMIEVFPRRTKCWFHKFGSSGDIEKTDALCILPQNIINEKIFLVMWLWFVILAVLTAIQLVYRIAVFYSPSLRIRLLEHKANMRTQPRVEQAIRNMHLGEFCLLDSMGRNLDTLTFRKLLQGMTEASEEVEDYSPSAPLSLMGTYKPFHNRSLHEADTLPRQRQLPGIADTGL